MRDRLKAWRAFYGMSQWRIAEKIGISAAAVGMWESSSAEHATEPTHDNLAAFCDALGISLSQFWGPVPSPPKRSKRKAA